MVDIKTRLVPVWLEPKIKVSSEERNIWVRLLVHVVQKFDERVEQLILPSKFAKEFPQAAYSAFVLF